MSLHSIAKYTYVYWIKQYLWELPLVLTRGSTLLLLLWNYHILNSSSRFFHFTLMLFIRYIIVCVQIECIGSGKIERMLYMNCESVNVMKVPKFKWDPLLLRSSSTWNYFSNQDQKSPNCFWHSSFLISNINSIAKKYALTIAGNTDAANFNRKLKANLCFGIKLHFHGKEDFNSHLSEDHCNKNDN